MLDNKKILITGGTGSFGKKFVEMAFKKNKPKESNCIFSRDELKQYEMQHEYSPVKNIQFGLFSW